MEQFRVWGAQVAASVRETVGGLVSYVPGLLLALALLAVGWLLARLTSSATRNLIGRMDWLFLHTGASSVAAAANLQNTTARAASTLVFWAVMLAFVAAAARGLGSPLIDGWSTQFFEYLPILVGGALIILLGVAGGALAREIIESAAGGADVAHSQLVGRLIQAAIVVAAFVIGAEHLGLDVSFLGLMIIVVVGVLLAGMALAMALGTREHLANLIGARYLRKHYRVGDKIRVGSIEGRILQIVDGCVFVESDDGDISIPGVYFAQQSVCRIDDNRTS
ncbi:MAG TPA: hypothetical protein VIV14_01060 [Gammaproteobacteria bacterium]